MARAKVILVDADVISHFIATDFGQEAIASSNFRDVAPYCEANGIEYIGTLDNSFNCKEKGTLGHRSMQPVYNGCNKGQ